MELEWRFPSPIPAWSIVPKRAPKLECQGQLYFNIVNDYQVGKGQYVQVKDEELAEIAIESRHTVEIG